MISQKNELETRHTALSVQPKLVATIVTKSEVSRCNRCRNTNTVTKLTNPQTLQNNPYLSHPPYAPNVKLLFLRDILLKGWWGFPGKCWIAEQYTKPATNSSFAPFYLSNCSWPNHLVSPSVCCVWEYLMCVHISVIPLRISSARLRQRCVLLLCCPGNKPKCFPTLRVSLTVAGLKDYSAFHPKGNLPQQF